MATLNKRTNDDGLVVVYGRDKVKGAEVGSIIHNDGLRKVIILQLEASRMDLSGGIVGERPNHFIPAGSFIESATIVVTEAFDSGASATLDLGLCNKDGTYTNLDEDGIDVAVAETALDTADKTVACDGALIGTTLTTGGYLSYDLDSIVYTAGKGYVIVTYRPAFMSATAPD